MPIDTEPPSPSREQLRNVLKVAVGNCHSPAPRPVATYEPLAWLLRDDVGSQLVRRCRRSLYRKLVTDLAVEFGRLYTERLAASNGPWDFQSVYTASVEARRIVRRMRWCAFMHLCRLPGASAGSVQAWETMRSLLSRAADPNIA